MSRCWTIDIMKKQPLYILALLAWGAASAHAQNLQPGLWEMHTRSGAGDAGMAKGMAEMQKQMAQMPPEQRKQMQAMLAQQGMSIDASGGGIRTKVCITPEMAQKDEVLPAQQGDCKMSASQRSGNTMLVRYECRQPVMKGESRITFQNNRAYSVYSDNTVQEGGRQMRTTMEMDARWLASDCGALTPKAAPAAPKMAR